MDELVSIITPSYNSDRFISQTIQSVINQTYNNWEMIIVDDCSNDKSVEIINDFIKIDNRIKLIKLSENSGPAIARNQALRIAKGKYIAFLDSDDIWLPIKLEEQIRFMVLNNYSFTFSSYNVINEENTEKLKLINVPLMISYNRYLRNTIIGCLTVVIDKSKVGYFEMPNIRSSQDMALWLEIMKRGYYAYGLKQVLANYRLVSNSNTSKKINAAIDVWKVYRNIEKLGLFFSIFNFLRYTYNAILKRV